MLTSCDNSHNITFFYNRANKTLTEKWETLNIVIIALGLPVCLIVVLANLMVIVAFLVNRRFHFPIYYLLGNMAAADLFAGLAYANLMLNTGPWTRMLSKKQWYIRSALIDISLTASVANLLAVAVERHQTIITMRLHSTMSKRRVVLVIISIWVVGIIMGLVPSLFWNCECDLDDCSTIAPLYSRRFLIFWAILNLLTFLIMLVMYFRIYFYVRRNSQHTSQQVSDARRETVFNLMKTISMVLGAFIICWTPGLIVLLLDGLLGKLTEVNVYEKFCLAIVECNSLVNPIIYSLRDAEMRRTFKWVLCRLCQKGDCQQREPLTTELDSPLKERSLSDKLEDKSLR